MKNGKLLTRKEKQLLSKLDMDPKDYLRVKKHSTSIEVLNVKTGEVKVIPYGRS